MPFYYDTSAPTSNNKNSITRTATDFGIRDFLLALNIQNPIRYPQLSTSINGAPRGGEPFLDTMVGTGAVPQQNPLEVDGVFRYDNAIIMNLYKNQDPNAPVFLDIENITTTPIFPTPPPGNNQYPVTPDSTTEQYGLLAKSEYAEYRKLATIKNLYLDATKQIDMADYISLQPIQTAQQLPSYDEAYGQLLGGGQVTTGVADVVGSLLNGQGVGISAGGGNGIGLVPNFDIRSSLAGRALGVAGALNDTKLGIIGAEQLALALANNAAFNTQQAILGKLNLQQNINAIFGSGEFEFPRPNYKITVSDDLLGQAVGTAERILGFTIPKSRLDDSGSLFFTESGIVSDTERANSMLTNTGKGQRKALADQFTATLLGTSQYDNPSESPFRSGYSPFYKGGGTRDFLVSGAQPKLYAFDSGERALAAGSDPSGVEPGKVYPFIQPITKEDAIPEINWNREKMVSESLFTDFLDQYGKKDTNHIKTPTHSWIGYNEKDSIVNKQPNIDSERTDVTVSQTNLADGFWDKKSLLYKTQLMFNSKGMKSIVSRKGAPETASQIQTSVVGGFISKGSAVLNGRTVLESLPGFTGPTNPNKEPDDVFCRSWTTFDRYDKVFKMIRSTGLNKKQNSESYIFTGGTKGWRLHNSDRMSVLGRNGFPQIAPYKTDTLTRPFNGSLPKKYMFSIENLAWVGSPAVNLLPIEQGPGDLLTGKFGRIMWFPPYDLTFSESSSVSLESNLFIGRGEPLYTYNNTERTGNLSFKIVVDHPSVANGFKNPNGPTEEYVRSWFAGCVDDDYFSSRLTTEEIAQVEQRSREVVETKTIPPVEAPQTILIFFPNDITDVKTVLEWNYEDGRCGQNFEGDGCGHGPYNGENYPIRDNQPESEWSVSPGLKRKDGLKYWPDATNFGLNNPGKGKPFKNDKDNKYVVGEKEFDTWNDPAYIAALKEYLKTTCPQCRATVTGHASAQGTIAEASYHNNWLAKKRAESIKQWLLDNSIIEESRIKFGNISVKTPDANANYSNETSVDSKGPKLHRYGGVVFKNEAQATVIKIPKTITEPVPIELNQQVAKRYYSELDFFEELLRTDSFVFDSFREKIRYFHPAFHSTTPEGLNSRLTFLLQCTRQGPTLSSTEPQNLAFGAPPVCILRIGDFYNTKIMIDNLNIDYEPLVWDLNPEGVGVQPMIANVTISFKYIGGSSMYGPINKLQNALSFNYFANSEVYDPRADYIASVETIRANNLIKNLPKEEELSSTRETFATKVGAKEDMYLLVPGLDPSTQSMGALDNQQPTFTKPPENQTANSQGGKQVNTTTATEPGQATSCDKDRANLYWVDYNVDNSPKNAPIRFYLDPGTDKDVRDNWSIGFQFYLNDPNYKISQPYFWFIDVTDKTTGTLYTKGPRDDSDWLFYGQDKTKYIDSRRYRNLILDDTRWVGLPLSTIQSGDYSVTIRLSGVTDGSCEITFDTETGEATQELTPCGIDSSIISIGRTGGDTSSTYIPITKDTDNKYLYDFYIVPKSTNAELLQDYKLTGKIINDRTKEEYIWDKGITVSKTFINNTAEQNRYKIYLSETTPKTPEPTEDSDDTYNILFQFTGALTACTLDVSVGGPTNSSQQSELAAKQLKVEDVIQANVASEGGSISYSIVNKEPSKFIISTEYNIKNIIKSVDGSEQYMLILKYSNFSLSLDDNESQPTDNFVYTSDNSGNIAGAYFNLSETTPVCKGLDPNKKYFMETILFNDVKNSVVDLNKINLEPKTITQTGPKVTKIGYVEVRQTVDGPYAFRVTACQEGILKENAGVSEQILSDADYEAFVNKGIKIRLELAASKQAIFEKTITWRPFDATGPDDFFNQSRLFGGGVSLGDVFKPSSDSPLINLIGGDYNLILYYENNVIDTIPVNINSSTPFNYFNDCGTQTSSANNTPSNQTTPATTTATQNSLDADVVNAIGIKKVYPYDTQYDTISVDFEWNRKKDLPSFVLQDSKTYKGQVSITTEENGQRITIDLGVEGTFYVRRNDNTSVIFGSGPTSANETSPLANTQDDATAPSGKAWEIGKTWNCELALDEIDEDKKNKIKAAQRNPNSNFKISWDTGSKSNVSFYLDNTPQSQPAGLTLPITHQDEFDSNGCDDAHAFGRQKGKSSGKTLVNATSEMLNKLYDAGLNGKVTSLRVGIGKIGNNYTTKYTVVVDKTETGVAYTGFDTRGSCGGRYVERADGQVLTGTENTNQSSPCYLKPVTQCLVDQGIAVANSFDFPLILILPSPLEFKQFFYQFAKPSKPAH